MKMQYKIGDRVKYAGESGFLPDTGTVVSIDRDYVRVKWDSNGETLLINEEKPHLFSVIDADKDTIRKVLEAHCIVLGYNKDNVTDSLVDKVFDVMNQQADPAYIKSGTEKEI
jgi:hypothetical protein